MWGNIGKKSDGWVDILPEFQTEIITNYRIV